MKRLDYGDQLKILAVCMLFPFFLIGYGQTWPGFQQLGGIGNENSLGLRVNAAGAVYVAGWFEDTMAFGDESISVTGEADIFLAKFSEEGAPIWISYGGGVLDETINAIAEDQDGNIICIGTYWIEATFGNFTLTSSTSTKAIFVLKYAPDGNLIWGKSIDGTTLKDATDVTIDTENNLLICGFFKDQLRVEDTTLHSVGESDLFVLKLSSTGEKIWVHQEGYKGDTHALTLALTSNEDIIVGGFYNDTTRLGNFELAANTYDRDVFLARMTQQGEVLWAKRAGGVHDDEIVELVVDENDQIYATGYLVGVMNLSDQIAIQSGNGNSDFYLMKYSPAGEVLQARAMGGTQVQQTTDLQINGNNLLLSGLYFGSMSIDGITLSTPGIVSGFIGSYRKEDLGANWLTSIDGDQIVTTNHTFIDSNNQVWLAGTFSSELDLGDGLTTQGGFDLYVGPLSGLTTSAQPTPPASGATLKIYPNPARTVLYIETNLKQYQVALVNGAGQLIHSGKNLTSIDIQHLPKGIYSVLVNNPDNHFFEKIILE